VDTHQGKQEGDVSTALPAPPAHQGQSTPLWFGTSEANEGAKVLGQIPTDQFHGDQPGPACTFGLVGDPHLGPLLIIKERMVRRAGHVTVGEFGRRAYIDN
jgi:hypothetical protein